MIGFQPRDVARDAAIRAFVLVNGANRSFEPLEGFRPRLLAARNILDEACRKFEADLFLEEHDAFYLPLFDALSHAAACTGRRVIRKKHVGLIYRALVQVIARTEFQAVSNLK